MKNKRGNILFLILLAVVLFAALSYAVTQSMRGGGNDASNEKTSAQTSELLNYYAQIDAAVQRMIMTGGLKESEINFYYQSNNKFISSPYDNDNCTTSNCRVFDPAGGAVIGKNFNSLQRVSSTGVQRALLISIPGVGTDKADLALALYSVKPSICKDINNRSGLGDYLRSANFTETSTILYYYNSVSGPLADTTTTLNVPSAAGMAGTFCACNGATATTCESNVSADFYPMVIHVVLAR